MNQQEISPHTIRETMLALVQARGPQKSICPSEVVRALLDERDGEEWRSQMDGVRAMAHRLGEEGRIIVTQKGERVDIRTAKGPVRLQLRPPTVGDEPIRFILDVHLGKLARWLRLLGFDTLYRNDLDDPEIVEIATTEGRTILTRDGGIMKRRAATRGYLVQSTEPQEQLREVLDYYQLRDHIQPFHRCLVCNGLLTPVEKAMILDQLEPKTIHYYDSFFQCTECGKIYWQGTHYERMREFLARLDVEA